MAQQETPGPHADPKQGPALEQMSHFLDTAWWIELKMVYTKKTNVCACVCINDKESELLHLPMEMRLPRFLELKHLS